MREQTMIHKHDSKFTELRMAIAALPGQERSVPEALLLTTHTLMGNLPDFMMAAGLKRNFFARPSLLAVQRDLVGLGEPGQESGGDDGDLHDCGL